jgi:pimeloyl-ACP methyl ester carboxylesterase
VTYVLIHGGGSTARFWDRLLPFLEGQPALAVDLPGRNGKPADFGTLSVDDEVASVVADVEAARVTDPIVVVAHSSGGLVVPGIVAGLGDRVAHVVLSAALVPTEGGLGIDCMKPRHREGLVASVEAARRDGIVITLPGAPADPEPFRTAYGGDPLDDDTLAFVTDAVRCVPDTVHHYFQPVHWSVAAHVPVTYLLNTRDRPIPSETQEQMVTHLPRAPHVVRLDSGHVPAVTDPEGFAKLIGSVLL